MKTTSLQYETRIARSTFTNIVFNCSRMQLGYLPQKQDIIRLGYVNRLGSLEDI